MTLDLLLFIVMCGSIIIMAFMFICTFVFLCYSSSGSKRYAFGVVKDVSLAEHSLILFPFVYVLNALGYFIWSKSEHFDELRLYDPVLNAMMYRALDLVDKYGVDPELVETEYDDYVMFYLEKKYTVNLDKCSVNDTRVILTPLLLRKLRKLQRKLNKMYAIEKAQSKVNKIVC